MCYQCREKGSGERCNTLVNFFSQWFLAMARSNGTSNSIQPWHLTMAPSNGTPAMAPSNGTEQWHPSNGTEQWRRTRREPRLELVASIRQWHRAMASSHCPHNGAQRWHPTNGTHCMAPRQWHPSMAPTMAMAPSNGSAMAPNVNPAKVGSQPPSCSEWPRID